MARRQKRTKSPVATVYMVLEYLDKQRNILFIDFYIRRQTIKIVNLIINFSSADLNMQ